MDEEMEELEALCAMCRKSPGGIWHIVEKEEGVYILLCHNCTRGEKVDGHM